MLEIYFWNGRFLFKGNQFSGNYHKHFPLQLIASVEEEVSVSTAGGQEVQSHAILIDSDVEHVCANHKTSVSIFIDPETDMGEALKARRVSGPLSPLPFENLDRIRYDFESFRRSANSDREEAGAFFDKVVFSYIDEKRKRPEIDGRIGKILSLLPSIPDKRASVRELAAAVDLSETRLMHLFKETVGTPIRRYLLWKRLLDGISLIKDGRSLTMAAVESGFSDYAHFSRTFKRMFGSKVENIFKNDRFVQAYNCEK